MGSALCGASNHSPISATTTSNMEISIDHPSSHCIPLKNSNTTNFTPSSMSSAESEGESIANYYQSVRQRKKSNYYEHESFIHLFGFPNKSVQKEYAPPFKQMSYYYNILPSHKQITLITGSDHLLAIATCNEEVFIYEIEHHKMSHRKIQFDQPITHLSCGNGFCVIVMNSHSIFTYRTTCQNEYGELGIQFSNSDDPLHHVFYSKNRIKFLKCGYHHTIAVTECDELICFGRNQHFECGTGESQSHYPIPHVFTNPSLTQISHLSCGDGFSFFVTQSKHVYCCGNNSNGACGMGIRNEVSQIEMVTHYLPRDLLIKFLECGKHYTMIVYQNNQVYSTGNNSMGTLSLAHNFNCLCFHEIITYYQQHAQNEITHLSCSSDHVMIVTKQNEIYQCGAFLSCWNVMVNDYSMQHHSSNNMFETKLLLPNWENQRNLYTLQQTRPIYLIEEKPIKLIDKVVLGSPWSVIVLKNNYHTVTWKQNLWNQLPTSPFVDCFLFFS